MAHDNFDSSVVPSVTTRQHNRAYKPEGMAKADAFPSDFSPPEINLPGDPLKLSPWAHMLLGTDAQGKFDQHLSGEWGPRNTPAVISVINQLYPGLGSQIDTNLDNVTRDLAADVLENHLPHGYTHICIPEVPFQITKKQAEIIRQGIGNPRFEELARAGGYTDLDECVNRMILDPQFTIKLDGLTLTTDDIFNSDLAGPQVKPMHEFLSSVFSYYVYNLDSQITAGTPLADIKELVTSIIARPDMLVFSVKPGSFAAHHLADIRRELTQDGRFFGRIPLLDFENITPEKAQNLRVTMELLMNGLLTDDPDVRLTIIEGKACFHENAARVQKPVSVDNKSYEYRPIVFDRNHLQSEQITDIAHTAEAVRGGFRNFLRRVYTPSMPLSGASDESKRRLEPTLPQINDIVTRILGRTDYLFTRIHYPLFDLSKRHLAPGQLLESLDPSEVGRLKPEYAVNSIDSRVVLDRLEKFSQYLSRRVTGKIPDETPEASLFV